MQYHVDGDLVAAGAATVSARDRGFLFGDAAVADLRAFGGSVFAAEAHERAFRRSCDRLGIAFPEDLLERCRETLRANDLDDARLRVTVSRGDAGGGLSLSPPGADDAEAGSDGDPADDAEAGPDGDRTPGAGGSSTTERSPTVVVAPAPAPRGGTEGEPPWDGPATLQTVKVRRPDDRAVPADLGTGSRLSAVLARDELIDTADEALVRGPEGTVVGGAASNLCFVGDDGLHTPGTGPVAPGVVRSIALDVADDADVPVHEDAPSPGAVRDAREAFLTSTWWGVRPVGTVDGIDVGGGPLTELVGREYERRVEADHY